MSSTTLYRFRIDLSDIDRNVYEKLDFRVALHPSETLVYLLTRVFAYALNFREGLEFSPGGLSDPDAPALMAKSLNGRTELWIEIGNPSAKKLHRASKASPEVKIYTYKDTQALIKGVQGQDVHRLDQIQALAFDPKFLERLSERIEKDVRWQVLHNEGMLTVSDEDFAEETEIKALQLS